MNHARSSCQVRAVDFGTLVSVARALMSFANVHLDLWALHFRVLLAGPVAT
jgi:hypothetical protein